MILASSAPCCFRIDFKILLITFKAHQGRASSYIAVLLTPHEPEWSLGSFFGSFRPLWFESGGEVLNQRFIVNHSLKLILWSYFCVSIASFLYILMYIDHLFSQASPSVAALWWCQTFFRLCMSYCTYENLFP